MYKKLLAVVFFVVVLSIGAVFYVSGSTEGPPATWEQVLSEPEHTKVDDSKPLRNQIRTIELAGRTFKIPLMYIDAALDPGLQQDGVLLEVIWPGMRSTYELKNRTEYQRIRNEEGQLGWILLEAAENRPSLDEQIKFNKETHAKTELVETVAGLEKWSWFLSDGNAELKISDEVYVQKGQDGHISDYIRCDPNGKVKIPQCHHKFLDKGLLYDLGYNKAALLSDWQAQRNKAIEFINSFEIR